ncbi:Photosystem I assembly protein Ycf4 [Camellia lanceoleosa]|uniref:Photosystem I assembly protein Ycf4 n=1 Tax=Camellia lanceoleosa TaxID=1840588 RepID=A0ACC0I060_9ERIC|nr:Photosystem I assembly protein Ycf4 [Camellia lanceoleosa]
MNSSDRIVLLIDPALGILWMKTWFLWIPLNFIQRRSLIKIVSILIKERQINRGRSNSDSPTKCAYLWCTISWNVGSGYDRFDRKEE